MNYYYLNESGEKPELIVLDKYKRKETILQTHFLPKKVINVKKNEIARAIMHCGGVKLA